jgi:transposase
MKHPHQGEKLSMDKIREILRLHELGHNQTAIAHSCAVARSTVQDYLRRAIAKGITYAQVSQISNSEAQELLGKGQRQSLSPIASIDFATVALERQQKGVTLALLWQEGIDQQQWTCSYATFCRYYNQWRGTQKLSMRQVHKAGEKLFVDYCGPTLPVVNPENDEVVNAQIFVACMGASNYTFAEATPSQELPHWVASHQRALAFLGGVPQCIVPDNLKSGVTSPCHYEPGINQSYQEFAEHYQVAIIPARPHKPRDKGKVEKAVQEVERQILAPLRQERFTSFSALNAAIAARVTQLNQRVMKSYGLSRQELFEQVDRPALNPLPSQPFCFARWKVAKVSPDYHIEVARHFYSVPYWFVQREVRVKITEKLIEVFHDGQRIAAHEHSRIAYRHSTLAEHMPPQHWAYKRQSKERFLAWAQLVGEQTYQQAQAIFDYKEHEEQAFRTLKGLQSLASKYGSPRLEAACRRANCFGIVGLRRIRAILQNQLDKAELPTDSTPPTPAPVPDHDNVRGAQYYH